MKRQTIIRQAIRIFSRTISIILLLVLASISDFSRIQAQEEIVSLEIRYLMPDAGEVFLVWGIGGWQLAPEDYRPEGTVVDNGVLRTPMKRQGDMFILRLQLPPWTSVDYGFLITMARDGTTTSLWEIDGEKDFQSVTSQRDTEVNIISEMSLPKITALDKSSNIPLITQEIHYRMPDAGEVYLYWGVDGWIVLPEDLRPIGTEIVDNLMQTPMTRDGELFIAAIQAPLDSVIDYGFLLTMTSAGEEIQPVWDGDYNFFMVDDDQNEAIEVISTLNLDNEKEGKKFDLSSSGFVKIIYQLPGAGTVDLIWGLNDWTTLPEDQLPEGTTIENGVMKTPMIKDGEEFSIRLQFPQDSSLDYGFLITSTQEGEPVNIWEVEGDSGYYESITSDGILTVQSGAILPSMRSATSSRRLVIALYLLISVIIVFFVGYLFDYRL